MPWIKGHCSASRNSILNLLVTPSRVLIGLCVIFSTWDKKNKCQQFMNSKYCGKYIKAVTLYQPVTADQKKSVLALGITKLYLTKQDKIVESTKVIPCLYKADVTNKYCKIKPSCF